MEIIHIICIISCPADHRIAADATIIKDVVLGIAGQDIFESISRQVNLAPRQREILHIVEIFERQREIC